MPELTMRTSERGALKSCAQKWYWAQVEGLRPKREANPLWFGQAIHQALADWYRKGTRRGPDPVETFHKFLEGDRKIRVTNAEEEAEYVDAVKLGEDMLRRYVAHYGSDENWDVIATERKMSFLLPRPQIELFGVTQPKVPNWLRYVMTWDGIYLDKNTGEVWLMEHKTAASIQVNHLPLDDQAGSYWAFATNYLRKRGVLKANQEIAGIMYNFLRKATDDERPVNEDGLRTNLPKKQHYVSALYNFYGEDGSAEEMKAWEEDLPRMTLAKLTELAEVQGLTVLGDPSANQPAPYFERIPVYRSRNERDTQIRRIQEEAIFAEAYRKGWLPVTKAPDKMKCNMCPYKRMCELDEQGDQLSVEEFKENNYNVENPYLVYEKSA